MAEGTRRTAAESGEFAADKNMREFVHVLGPPRSLGVYPNFGVAMWCSLPLVFPPPPNPGFIPLFSGMFSPRV